MSSRRRRWRSRKSSRVLDLAVLDLAVLDLTVLDVFHEKGRSER